MLRSDAYLPTCRRGKTGVRSTHDRIVRHIGYARQTTGLCQPRAELAVLVNDFTPVINELWPRLEDHKYRWELHRDGLSEGCDKRVVSDIIATLIKALKAIGIADNKLLQAHTKADHRNPGGPAVSDFPLGCVKGVFDVTT
jgi:hypothetical protein